ncbi:hypothetical protein D3C75_1057350 [compost metagenome]
MFTDDELHGVTLEVVADVSGGLRQPTYGYVQLMWFLHSLDEHVLKPIADNQVSGYNNINGIAVHSASLVKTEDNESPAFGLSLG